MRPNKGNIPAAQRRETTRTMHKNEQEGGINPTGGKRPVSKTGGEEEHAAVDSTQKQWVKPVKQQQILLENRRWAAVKRSGGGEEGKK